MARVIDNSLIKGVSGAIGNMLIYRTFNNNTFVYRRPRKPTSESPLQKQNRVKFAEASAYAKDMMKDPLKKEEYKNIAKKLNLPNAYTAALTEYMRKANIHLSNVSAREEKKELTIRVEKKGYEIQGVEVILTDLRGQVVEEGTAQKETATYWIYKMASPVSVGEVQILVRVKDRTGNKYEARFGAPGLSG